MPTFKAGEPVRQARHNPGDRALEFLMNTTEAAVAPQQVLAAMLDTVHLVASILRLQSGERGDTVRAFGDAVIGDFACLILRHFEGRMHGTLTAK